MAYTRKTSDEYQVQGYYPGYGWECVTSETNRFEAKQRWREYKENELGTAFRIVRKRIKLQTV